MSKPVPTSRFQQSLQHQHQQAIQPQSGVILKTSGRILEVYDAEYLQISTPDEATKAKLEQCPGLLFARVLTKSNVILTLAFAEPEEQIYSTYGNFAQLVNRQVMIHFQNQDIQSGTLYLTRSWTSEHVNIAEATKTHDIGGLL